MCLDLLIFFSQAVWEGETPLRVDALSIAVISTLVIPYITYCGEEPYCRRIDTTLIFSLLHRNHLSDV